MADNSVPLASVIWQNPRFVLFLGATVPASAPPRTLCIALYDAYMIWEKGGSSLEIRTQGQLPDGKPALDEIVAHGAVVHLEQMCHDHWWMGLEAGGKHFHLNFGVQDGRLWVRLSDQDDDRTEWEGDSRERPIPGVDD